MVKPSCCCLPAVRHDGPMVSTSPYFSPIHPARLQIQLHGSSSIDHEGGAILRFNWSLAAVASVEGSDRRLEETPPANTSVPTLISPSEANAALLVDPGVALGTYNIRCACMHMKWLLALAKRWVAAWMFVSIRHMYIHHENGQPP